MLSMNETIRARRHALGMTQEQLADRLGVSAPAVSKWEQGASYPDVTLLSALARTLGIDLNTLMGFARTPERAEITRMLTRVNDAAKSEGIEAGLSLAKAFAQEYPTCGALLFGLAATLEGRMIMTGMTQEEREPIAAQLEDWYARAADSEDEEARESAAHLLASRALGRGDTDAAQAMMERLPREPLTARWTLETGLLPCAEGAVCARGRHAADAAAADSDGDRRGQSGPRAGAGRPDEPICGAAVHAPVYRPSGAADARAGEEGYACLHGAYPRDAGGAADAMVAGGLPAV